MDLRLIQDNQKNEYNSLVTHVMQSWQWGEFRKSLGIPLYRYGIFENGKLTIAFQLTLHQIPLTNKYVGYLPKGPFPDKNLAEALKEISKKHSCSFIKIEPNVIASGAPIASRTLDRNFRVSLKPLFTKHNFVIDLTKSEEELLRSMHPKTRYNIKIAQKHQVIVEERADDKALEIYLKLYFETTKRQGYHGHNENYHKAVWKVLSDAKMARFLIAFYRGKPLTAWMMINFKNKLYYPYGGSSIENREVMANNLVAWEAIKLGKKLKLKEFDMWGALGPTPNPKDPWIGFHRFKSGYGGELIEYIGTYDLISDLPTYILFNFIDRLTPLKIFLLKLLK